MSPDRARAPRYRRRRWISAGAAAFVLTAVAGTAIVVGSHHAKSAPTGPDCTASADGQVFGLDQDQAANATTIAAVARRDGLPDHAVTVALATAIQESDLHNLSYGDRDSLGLFQQRPSQGWGTAEQVLTPRYAASAFFAKLTAVSGWQTMAVTDAAQRVQHSGAPSAYSRWEAEAKVLARTITGEVPAGFTCRVATTKGSEPDPGLAAAMAADLGSVAGTALPTPAQGWTTAAWLVGHARQQRISQVTFAGHRWTARTGTWTEVPATEVADGSVRYG